LTGGGDGFGAGVALAAGDGLGRGLSAGGTVLASCSDPPEVKPGVMARQESVAAKQAMGRARFFIHLKIGDGCLAAFRV